LLCEMPVSCRVHGCTLRSSGPVVYTLQPRPRRPGPSRTFWTKVSINFVTPGSGSSSSTPDRYRSKWRSFGGGRRPDDPNTCSSPSS